MADFGDAFLIGLLESLDESFQQAEQSRLQREQFLREAMNQLGTERANLAQEVFAGDLGPEVASQLLSRRRTELTQAAPAQQPSFVDSLITAVTGGSTEPTGVDVGGGRDLSELFQTTQRRGQRARTREREEELEFSRREAEQKAEIQEEKEVSVAKRKAKIPDLQKPSAFKRKFDDMTKTLQSVGGFSQQEAQQIALDNIMSSPAGRGVPDATLFSFVTDPIGGLGLQGDEAILKFNELKTQVGRSGSGLGGRQRPEAPATREVEESGEPRITGLAPEKREQARQALQTAVDRLRNEGVPDDEIANELRKTRIFRQGGFRVEDFLGAQ